MMKGIISRPKYREKIKPFVDKDIIKVFAGQRRVGKSFLLKQIVNDLEKDGIPSSRIIYVNKELADFEKVQNYGDLIAYVESKKVDKGRKRYLLIDEVQEIEHFEKALVHFQATGGFDIYCTGSNASLLSGELATLLSGRYIEFEVHGLSYVEFLKFHKLGNSEASLQKFIRYGGLPYLHNLELNDEVVFDYLHSVYNTIILRDVVSRFRIRDVEFLHRLVRYLAGNVGDLISASGIAKFVKSQRRTVSITSIISYISSLTNAFFVYKVPRIDIKGKKVFEVNEKYYFEDLGLRNSVNGLDVADIGRQLENVVYNQLKYLDYDVKVGLQAGKEVDFVCEKFGRKLYVQVAYLLKNRSTIDREFAPLLNIKDNYPKIVVSMDKLKQSGRLGVTHMNILDFLTARI